MKFKYPKSVIVNFDVFDYVFIICDTITMKRSENPYCSTCLMFYKKGELVARCPEGSVESLEWFENSFDTTKTVLLARSFKDVF